MRSARHLCASKRAASCSTPSRNGETGLVRVFEIYRDPAAYQAHVQTAHFQRFRATTDAMVRSRKLLDAVPVSLATKPGVTP